jgi:hypothetical protein
VLLVHKDTLASTCARAIAPAVVLAAVLLKVSAPAVLRLSAGVSVLVTVAVLAVAAVAVIVIGTIQRCQQCNRQYY